jgi:hypothetical protein
MLQHDTTHNTTLFRTYVNYTTPPLSHRTHTHTYIWYTCAASLSLASAELSSLPASWCLVSPLCAVSLCLLLVTDMGRKFVFSVTVQKQFLSDALLLFADMPKNIDFKHCSTRNTTPRVLCRWLAAYYQPRAPLEANWALPTLWCNNELPPPLLLYTEPRLK